MCWGGSKAGGLVKWKPKRALAHASAPAHGRAPELHSTAHRPPAHLALSSKIKHLEVAADYGEAKAAHEREVATLNDAIRADQAAVARLYGPDADYATLLPDSGFDAASLAVWYTPVEDRSLASWAQVAHVKLQGGASS